ncbi:MAG: type II toxin-antitoxin system RelB/DinJ family antitoxin [Synergistaceae bacterium]|nr:type II toxin-antitoxin system RelB/DinJ family antitoxin [Synergistaceae bacterium]
MSSSQFQLRLDNQLKEEATQVFSNLGLDLPTAIRIFLKRAVQVHGIPFPMQLKGELNSGMLAMREMGAIAAKNGIADMSLDEINAEIEAVRRKRALEQKQHDSSASS